MSPPVMRHVQEIDSTSRAARDLAAQGAPEWSCVRAEWQSAGRGRGDHGWESARGKNLLFSVLLWPPSGARLSQLVPLWGLACLRAVEPLAAQVRLKWPNDLWASGRKLGGILLEQAGAAVVAGVGINVNQRRFFGELKQKATSLALLLGMECDRDALLEAVLGQARELYQTWQAGNFEAIRRAWEEKDAFMGKRVEVGGLKGREAGMDSEGALLLKTSQGLRRVQSGELRDLRSLDGEPLQADND